MKLKIVIVDLELSPRAKKRLIRIGVPLAVLLGGATLAYAGGWGLPNQWSAPGSPNYAGPNLKASDLDDNFAALADAGATLQMQVSTLQMEAQPIAPTIQTFTMGAGSYTRTAGVSRAPLYLRIRMAGGGGGGAGTNSTAPVAGVMGGTTLFGPLTALGGSFAFNLTGSTGGAQATITGTGVQALVNLAGGNGSSASNTDNTSPSGAGGTNPLGGGGGGVAGKNSGGAAVANTGGGGGGAGCQDQVGACAGGGGAGGYIEAIITSPAATYGYVVGAGGMGGQGSWPGGNGADGVIIIEEHYQ